MVTAEEMESKRVKPRVSKKSGLIQGIVAVLLMVGSVAAAFGLSV